MSSAPIPRDPDSRTASQVRRGSTSSAPGSYRVVRSRNDTVVPPAGGTLDDYGFIRVNSGTANGSTLGSGVTALKGSSVSNSLDDTSWASYSSATGLFTVSRAGLWQLSGYIVVTSPVAKSVIQPATPYVAIAEQSPMGYFHDDFIAGVTGGWSASSCSPPTPWWASSTGYVAYAAPSSGAVLNQFYLVMRPIAFFD